MPSKLCFADHPCLGSIPSQSKSWNQEIQGQFHSQSGDWEREEMAWDEEIKSRIDAGELPAGDYAELQKQMQQRFAR